MFWIVLGGWVGSVINTPLPPLGTLPTRQYGTHPYPSTNDNKHYGNSISNIGHLR